MRRAARKLLRMVSDLHVRGYQRLRIVPHVAPVGAWRCLIVPVTSISSVNGLLLASHEEYERFAPYSGASANEYWGWQDKAHCTPGQLADVFLKRWPDLAASGYGPDWLYAGWYQQMLHITHPDDFPVAFDDYGDCTEVLRSTNNRLIPKPPVGLAPDIHAH